MTTTKLKQSQLAVGSGLGPDSTQSLTTAGYQPYPAPSVFWPAGAPVPASQVVLAYKFAVATTFAGNFAGLVGGCLFNPTSTATFTVYKNGTAVGTFVISTSGAVTGTTTSGAAVDFAVGDLLTVQAPSSQDATLQGPYITPLGVR